MSKTLTLAIPARREPAILETLIHLASAVKNLPSDVQVETIVCVNGCDGRTRVFAEQLLGQGYGNILGLRIIESEPGKLVAQKKIYEERKFKGVMISHDADVIVNAEGIAALYAVLSKREELNQPTIAYAQCVPIVDLDFCSPLKRFYSDVYAARYRHLSCRPWVHGRIHGMTTVAADCVFDDSGVSKRIAKTRSHPLAKSLALYQGPIVDDIFSSRIVCHAYGSSSIVKVPDAKAAFVPPFDIRELFLSIRRAVIEIKRLDILYPEHMPVHQKFETAVALSDAEIFGRIRSGATTTPELLRLDFAYQLEETLGTFVRVHDLKKPSEPLGEKVKKLLDHPALVAEREDWLSERNLATEVRLFLHGLLADYSKVAAAERNDHWVELAETKRNKIELGLGDFWLKAADVFGLALDEPTHSGAAIHGNKNYYYPIL
jgi:hypothetical protein